MATMDRASGEERADAMADDRLAPTVDGRVESIGDGVVVGWAWSSGHPDRRVEAQVMVDGISVATGLAHEYAPGLSDIGIGDGLHAFTIPLPESLADGGEHAIAVAVAGVSLPILENAIRPGEGAWERTTFTPTDAPAAPPVPDDLDDEIVPSPATVAVIGRDGWLFGLTQCDIDRVTDGQPTSGKRTDFIVADLDRTAAALHALGVRHVVAVVPSKWSAHPEHAPEGLVLDDQPRTTVEVVRLVRDCQHADVLDLLPALRDAAASGPVFHPRGDVLSARGAFFAHRSVLKHAGLAAQGLLPLGIGEASFASVTAPLTALENLPIAAFVRNALVPCPELAPDGPGLTKIDEIDPSSRRGQRASPPDHLSIEGAAAPRVYEREDLPSAPRILMLGDPVMHALTPWLAETTSRLVVLSTRQAPLEQIELELPALVLQILDERLVEAASSVEPIGRGLSDAPPQAPEVAARARPGDPRRPSKKRSRRSWRLGARSG
jgi:hypothetical protein